MSETTRLGAMDSSIQAKLKRPCVLMESKTGLLDGTSFAYVLNWARPIDDCHHSDSESRRYRHAAPKFSRFDQMPALPVENIRLRLAATSWVVS